MNPLFLISGIGMMSVALVSVVYWKVCSRIFWALFLWGALAWVVGISLKTVASIPTRTVMSGIRDVLPKYLSGPMIWIYIGLLTGIFECGVTLGFAYIERIRKADWKEAVGFGVGFGAIEAFLVGLSSFVIVLLVVLIPHRLPPKLIDFATSGSNSLSIIPAPIIERITAIFIHAFSCLLIIYAVRSREWKWFWVSFFYKTAVDSIAGFIHISYGIKNLSAIGIWVTELALLPFGIVGIWGLCVFCDRWKNLGEKERSTYGS